MPYYYAYIYIYCPVLKEGRETPKVTHCMHRGRPWLPPETPTPLFGYTYIYIYMYIYRI